MGNLCSAIRYVPRYIFGFIWPMIRPYIPLGYMHMFEDDYELMEETSSLLEPSFPDDNELVTVESQNFDKDNEETSVNNVNLLLDITTNFFKNYNFQTNDLSGKVLNRNFINTERSLQNSKVDPFGRKQLKWNFRHNDLASDLEEIRIEDTNNKPECEDPARSRYIYDQNQECNPQEQGETESLVTEHATVKSNKSSSRDRRRKYGTVQNPGTLAERGKFQQTFSDYGSIVERKKFTNQITDDNRPRLVRSRKVRRLSVPNLQSGSYFMVEDSNENSKLANYSFESVPIRVFIECFRRISHPKLFSGGWVSSEELSEHFCIPDYYSENPITYKELPEGFEFPRYSPVKMPPQQEPLRPTSCSGGGVVPDPSSKVSLPSLFPEANPLLSPVSSQTDTRSSMSFGGLAMTEEDQNAIFSDLIFQSRQWDAMLLAQAAEREDQSQFP